MKKELIVLGIIILFICVGVSGCINNKEKIETKIVDYDITTYWRINDAHYSEKGFYHNIPENVDYFTVFYQITGNITNIAEEMLDSIIIDIVCYDNQKNELFNTKGNFLNWFTRDRISQLPEGGTKFFSIKIFRDAKAASCEYWNNIDSFDFVITIW